MLLKQLPTAWQAQKQRAVVKLSNNSARGKDIFIVYLLLHPRLLLLHYLYFQFHFPLFPPSFPIRNPPMGFQLPLLLPALPDQISNQHFISIFNNRVVNVGTGQDRNRYSHEWNQTSVEIRNPVGCLARKKKVIKKTFFTPNVQSFSMTENPGPDQLVKTALVHPLIDQDCFLFKDEKKKPFNGSLTDHT